jgi:hypothetical protein
LLLSLIAVVPYVFVLGFETHLLTIRTTPLEPRFVNPVQLDARVKACLSRTDLDEC